MAQAGRARRQLPGAEVQPFDRCFITEMRRRAAESDIIIVNHHLFFADLAIKQAAEYAPDAGILPEAGAVIFDEAHELEDVAGSYFGVSVSNLRVEELVRDVEATLQRNHCYRPRFRRVEERARAVAVVLSLLPAGRRAASPSRTGASSWKKTATSSSGCSSRSTRLGAELRESAQQAGGGPQPSRGARRSCGCSLAS